MSWKEFEERRNNGEQIFIGNYPKEVKNAFKKFAHNHTKRETKSWLDRNEANLDIMYTNGRPDCYDKLSEDCARIRCIDGFLWN